MPALPDTQSKVRAGALNAIERDGHVGAQRVEHKERTQVQVPGLVEQCQVEVEHAQEQPGSAQSHRTAGRAPASP